MLEMLEVFGGPFKLVLKDKNLILWKEGVNQLLIKGLACYLVRLSLTQMNSMVTKLPPSPNSMVTKLPP